MTFFGQVLVTRKLILHVLWALPSAKNNNDGAIFWFAFCLFIFCLGIKGQSLIEYLGAHKADLEHMVLEFRFQKPQGSENITPVDPSKFTLNRIYFPAHTSEDGQWVDRSNWDPKSNEKFKVTFEGSRVVAFTAHNGMFLLKPQERPCSDCISGCRLWQLSVCREV